MNIRTLTSLCTGVALLFSACLKANDFENTEIVHARGEYVLSFHSEISLKAAQEKAFLDARQDALEKVLGTRVSSVDFLLTSDEKSDYSGVVVTSSAGLIMGEKNKKFGWTPQKIDGESEENQTTIVFCEADFIVRKDTEKPDPSFVATIRGGRSLYNNQDKEIFTIVPEADGYLTVFYWNNRNDTTSIVFPRSRFESEYLKAWKKKSLSLIFSIDDSRKRRERGVLFFVFTREKCSHALLREKTGESGAQIDRWIAEIPVRDRYVYAIPVIIERK